MQYSKCLVNVKCIKGAQAIGTARHAAALPYGEVHEIRRCKEPGTTMNTHCDPLTQQDLNDAVDAYFDALDQPQGQPSHRSNRNIPFDDILRAIGVPLLNSATSAGSIRRDYSDREGNCKPA